MSSKLIQPPSMAASRGAIPRRTGNAKVLVSFNNFNGKTLSFSDKPFRLRPMFIGKVTEQSSVSSPNEQQEEEFTVSRIKEELYEALKGFEPLGFSPLVTDWSFSSTSATEFSLLVWHFTASLSSWLSFSASDLPFFDTICGASSSSFQLQLLLLDTGSDQNYSGASPCQVLSRNQLQQSACGSKFISSSHGWNAESPVSLKPLEDLLERYNKSLGQAKSIGR